MLDGEIKDQIRGNFALLIVQFLLNYIEYLFLTGSVIFSIVMLLFIILNLKMEFSFNFLKYFAFINPIYKSGNFSLGIKEVMQIFSVISLILLIIVSLMRAALKRLFNFNIAFSFKLKIIVVLFVITMSYIFAFLIVAFSDPKYKGFYFVFVSFYIYNLSSALFYFLFDAILKKIEIGSSSRRN